MQSKNRPYVPYAILLIIIILLGAFLHWLGGPDKLNIGFFYWIGKDIYASYPQIVAIALAVAIARENQGAAALAGFLSFEVITQGAAALSTPLAKIVNNPVSYWNDSFFMVCAITAGIVAGVAYNRFYKTKLPDWLGFFGGRRSVPIVSAAISLFIALILGNTWH
nr:PTS transporter subunit EIIC [Bacilli bacterium]